MTASLFIVTLARHLPFFEVCARSIAKHARGFNEVVVVVPTPDFEQFARFASYQTADGAPFRIRHRYEPAERGHIMMNATKCAADIYCPAADLIAHLDADSGFVRAVTPQDYLADGRIPILTKPYAESGDAQAWKPLVDRALGLDAPWEAMQRPELAYWRCTYSEVREHIEHLHRQPFFEYALTHHVAEFPTLGSWAIHSDESEHLYRRVESAPRFIHQSWSHHVDGDPVNLTRELEKLEAAIT